MSLVLRTAITAPVWRGESSCFACDLVLVTGYILPPSCTGLSVWASGNEPLRRVFQNPHRLIGFGRRQQNDHGLGASIFVAFLGIGVVGSTEDANRQCGG